MRQFSYDEYKFIIQSLKDYIPLLDYSEVNENTQRFCIIRHDVEFSVDRAYNLAKLEHEEFKIKTNYFFQLRNNSYNLISEKNIKLVTKIFDMGHNIGLHVHLGALDNPNLENKIKKYILDDIETISKYLKIKVNRFSYHRPPNYLLAMTLKIDGMINAYNPLFFQYYKEKRPEKLDVYYISDSQHKWNYGSPIDLIKKNVDKMQILMHPYSWSEKGYSSQENFSNLIDEKNHELKDTIKNECKHFSYD